MKYPKDRCSRCQKWLDETQCLLHPLHEDGSKIVCSKCETIIRNEMKEIH